MIEKEEFLPQNLFEQYFLNLTEQNRIFIDSKKFEYKELSKQNNDKTTI